MVYLAVGIGGIVGALLRYYLGLFASVWWGSPFPFATLLTACFWSTAFLARTEIFPPYVVTGLGTGVVGSFTTFSTLSSVVCTALLYLAESMLGGLFLSWACCRTGNHLFHQQSKEGKNHDHQ
ncbi:MAG: CrcB family protein [Bacillales bacterium]|nr:CrcB family protein [Bacillales bacterium]